MEALKNIILAVCALLMVSCGQPQARKKTATVSNNPSPVSTAAVTNTFTKAEWKNYPITITFDFSGDSKKVFDVYECYTTCSIYMRVDCMGGSTCTFTDGVTNQVRADIASAQTLSGTQAHVEWSDLFYNAFGTGLNRVEVRSTSIPTFTATQNNSLLTIQN